MTNKLLTLIERVEGAAGFRKPIPVKPKPEQGPPLPSRPLPHTPCAMLCSYCGDTGLCGYDPGPQFCAMCDAGDRALAEYRAHASLREGGLEDENK